MQINKENARIWGTFSTQNTQGGMIMHIAICDDNVADRKHLERLLSREGDKRMGTPNVLYIDSYGDKEHFLFNPLKYDIIFMDMVSTPTLTAEIVDTITKIGCTAPIVLYSSKIDYTAIPNLPANVIHQKKPYVPEPLPELLALGDTHVKGHIETIQAHHPDGSLNYIPVNDIMYYISEDSVHTVYLLDGTSVQVQDDASYFYLLTEPYKEFYRINKKVIINMKYLSFLTPLIIVMQDEHKFYINPLRHSEMKNLKQQIDQLY